MSRHAYWIATCLFLALVASKFSGQTGFTSLIRFGENQVPPRSEKLEGLPLAIVLNSSGYDGQFYAQIALDPTLRDPSTIAALDVPSYRARRILVPATAAVVAGGSPWWTLQVYALLNVACWLTLAWVLRLALRNADWISFARWAGCLFSMGVLESVRLSLVDLPAALFLTLAIVAQDRGLVLRSSIWVALTNLAKESSLLGAIALNLEHLRWPFLSRRKLLSLLVATLPLIAWSLYILWRLPSPAGTTGQGNFTWPLLGVGLQIKTCLTEIAAGNWDGRFTMGLFAIIGLGVQAGVLWRVRDFKSGWWRVGAAYALLGLFLSSWVWSGYWAACRALLPMTLAFNLLLPGNSRAFWPLWMLGNGAMLHALWRFL